MPVERMIAIVLAAPASSDRRVTGLTLSERARRVLTQAGFEADRLRMTRTDTDLAEALEEVSRRGEPVLLVRALDQLVAPSLIEPLLRDFREGFTVAFDEEGVYAGAMVISGSESLATARQALTAQGLTGAESLADPAHEGHRVTVDRRARFRVRNDQEARQADRWQFELVHKPYDAAVTIYLYRAMARPFTRIFLRLPLSPNAISVLATSIGLVGCAIASRPDWASHVLGLCLLLFGGVLDCCDGEVARLRLETTKAGGWFDAIGDDLSRLAQIGAVGLHVAPAHPSLPILGVTVATLALTLTSMLLIYWYCIFVIHSSQNQDYCHVLGMGPGQGDDTKRSIRNRIGDIMAQIARRDLLDLFILLFALVGLPELSLGSLFLGSIGGIFVILPTHLRIVRSVRAAS